MTDIVDSHTIAYDIESTGLDTQRDRIVEFGLTVFRDGKPEKRGRALLNPGIPIHPDASKVHGINDERVAKCQGFVDLLPRIARSFDDCDAIVGYNNTRFDDAMINAEAARAGSDWRIPDHKALDLMVFVNWYHRGQRHRTQEEIGRLYGVEPVSGRAHSAAVDTQMTGELLMAMVGAGVVPADIGAALAEQRRLAPVIEREFEDWGPWLYRDRKNNRLRMGAGKYCGQLLPDTSKRALSWYLGNIDDLPAKTRDAFQAAKDGRAQAEMQERMFEDEGEIENNGVDDVEGWGG